MSLNGGCRPPERERRLAELEDSGDPTTLSISGRPDIREPDDFASQLREALQTRVERMTLAEVIPAIEGLAVDFDDRLWVSRTPLPGEEGPIDIVTPDARYLGTIQPGGLQIPDAFGPDGLMAYVDTHDLGYLIVRVVQLAPDAHCGRRTGPGGDGNRFVVSTDDPLIIVDGVIQSDDVTLEDVSFGKLDIGNVEILKAEQAIEAYGERATGGVDHHHDETGPLSPKATNRRLKTGS